MFKIILIAVAVIALTIGLVWLIDKFVPAKVSVSILVFALNKYIESHFAVSLFGFLLSVVTSGVLVVIAIFFVGLKKSERALLSRVFLNIKNRIWQ